jgi:hypothetical protein
LLLVCGLCLALGFCGCKAKRPKSAVPVVGPAPVRTTLANDDFSWSEEKLLAEQNRTASGELMQVDFNAGNRRELDDTQTIAYVNGEPILAGEVLEPYADQLSKVKQAAPPEQYAALRKQLLQRDLPIHIDNRILVQAFHSTLDKDQKATLDSAIGNLFADNVQEMKDKFGVNTDYELEMELQKNNSSLSSIRQAFSNKVMAQEFLRSKLPNLPEPTRIEMVAYYQEHLKNYEIPARVRWEQIEVSYAQNGGKEGGIKVLSQIADELSKGVPFADVAKKYSNGPTAAQGGFWDWTQPGSLKDTELEQSLFTEPVGQVSDVLVGPSSYQIFRVVERQPAGHRPFEELQEEIKKKLVVERRGEIGEQILAEMRASATVQSIFDSPEANVVPATSADPFKPLTTKAKPLPTNL